MKDIASILVQHPSFADPIAFKIWVWCLSKVETEDTTVAVNVGGGYKMVNVKAGQFVFSRNSASKELGIPAMTIKRWIDRFSQDDLGNLVEINSGQPATLVTMRVSDVFSPLGGQAVVKLLPAENQSDIGGFEGGSGQAVVKLNDVGDNQRVNGKPEERMDYDAFVDFYNSKTRGILGVVRKPLSDKRKRSIRLLVRAYGKRTLADVIVKTMESDFLTGKNSKNWTATFDWILNRNNFDKILSGNYDNEKGYERRDNVVSI